MVDYTEIDKELLAGNKIADVSQKYGVHATSIRKRARRLNVPWEKKAFDWNKHKDLLESKLTATEVSEIIGCSRISVATQRKKMKHPRARVQDTPENRTRNYLAWMQAGFPTGERQNEGLSSYITGRER
jgi:hypothetical protein